MQIHVDFADNAPMPSSSCFCVPAASGPVQMGNNRNPRVGWSGLPDGTKSLALVCHDPDVPSVGDDVNQEGKTVPEALPRVDFFHWVLVDIDPSLGEIAEGQDSDGVTARGKDGGRQPWGVRGLNGYTGWFEGDDDMEGEYFGYDGPCPPWNDERMHHYVFTLYALDVESLGLDGSFGGEEARQAMQGHVLAEAKVSGRYTLNSRLQY